MYLTDGVRLRDPTVQVESFPETAPGGGRIGPRKGDVSQALDAVRLTLDIADLLIHPLRLLPVGRGAVKIGPRKGDLSQRWMQLASPRTSPTSL